MSGHPSFRQYQGTSEPLQGGARPRGREQGRYIASSELVTAVNTALAAEQPLLVTGDPGVGKTALAESIATELGLGDVLEFHTRSDSQARDLLYSFDSMRRFYDAQVGQPRARYPRSYVEFRALGEAINSQVRRVVLIDEIDKAPRDFPNDLLHIIDKMEFTLAETGEKVESPVRPIVVITSNREHQLPEPFLRRCVFHHISFPDDVQLKKILRERIGADQRMGPLYDAALRRFNALRASGDSLSRKPAIAELLVWVRVLLRAEYGPDALDESKPLPFAGVLLKNATDLERVLKLRTRS